jgi:hypothetical protein
MRTRVYTQRASAKGDVCSQHNTVRLLAEEQFHGVESSQGCALEADAVD